MMTTPFKGLVLILAVLVFAGSRQAAGQIHPMTLEDLSLTATSIVLGTAVKKESVWDAGGSRIMTEITIRVDESLKGGSATETVITVPGGRIGNVIYEVSDMPSFSEGEDLLLFAWEHPTGKNLVLGGGQGKLALTIDAETGRRTIRGGAALLAPAELGKTSIVATPGASDVSVDDVVSRIRAYVGD